MKPCNLVTLALLLCFTSCATPHPKPSKQLARVTYYDAHEDRFGSKLAIGGRAHEGWTMAAPSVIPFHKWVTVPDLKGVVGKGVFEIQDRGTALERAYRRGELRLDVFVANRAKLRMCKNYLPETMEVIIQ